MHKLGGVGRGPPPPPDYDQEEQQRGITIYLRRACRSSGAGHTVQPDRHPRGTSIFTADGGAEPPRSLDGAVVVFRRPEGRRGAIRDGVAAGEQVTACRGSCSSNKMDVGRGRNFRQDAWRAFHSRLTPRLSRRTGRPVPNRHPPSATAGPVRQPRRRSAGVIDLIEMKAKFFDARRPRQKRSAPPRSRRKTSSTPSSTPRATVRRTPPSTTRKDLITSAVLDGARPPTRRRCGQLVRRAGPSPGTILPGAERQRPGNTSASSPCSTAVTFLPAPARSTGRRWSASTRKNRNKEERRKTDPEGTALRPSCSKNGVAPERAPLLHPRVFRRDAGRTCGRTTRART